MNKKAVQLNLARKWRSKQFDAVIGQDLSVRILQNSLYSNQFFPVYLFSGQRGCGKTTSARLFAAAINCEQLEVFQKNPREQKIPCLVCPSCLAMAAHSHPDFIEIDAASYTGVDNVRDIIESASLLPVLGRKKMYLIDEAHMLSKAAFNAFLKILEEPPASVIFMLATTDPHKIIETVRSRCFQLFFTAIPTGTMAAHLAHVCDQEGITYDESALTLIAAETEGSARDALNLLEQVRFSQQRITVDAVLQVLGHMPEDMLLDLVERVIQADVQQVIAFFAQHSLEQYVPLAVWQKSTEVVRDLVFVKQGLKARGAVGTSEKLSLLAAQTSLSILIGYLRVLYAYELPLLRSTIQRTMLEMVFIELCQQGQPLQVDAVKVPSLVEKQVIKKEPSAELKKEALSTEQPPVADERWTAFMAQVVQLSDPMLQSIFKQGRFSSYDQQTQEVIVMFEREAGFFTDWLQDTKSTWTVLLEAAFGQGAHLKPLFGETKHEVKSSSSVARPVVRPVSQPEQKIEKQPDVHNGAKKNTFTKSGVARPAAQEMHKEIAIDVSDGDKWQKANLLKEMFGGSVVALQEDENHEETGQ